MNNFLRRCPSFIIRSARDEAAYHPNLGNAPQLNQSSSGIQGSGNWKKWTGYGLVALAGYMGWRYFFARPNEYVDIVLIEPAGTGKRSDSFSTPISDKSTPFNTTLETPSTSGKSQSMTK